MLIQLNHSLLYVSDWHVIIFLHTQPMTKGQKALILMYEGLEKVT